MNPLTIKPQFNLYQNVEYSLRDKNGNFKPLFQDNAFATYLLKHGYLNPLWINSWYASLVAPFLGHWAFSKRCRNLVTNAGLGGISSRLNGAGGAAAFTYIAVGTGTASASASDTTLQTESSTSGLSRASATASQVTTTVTNDTAQLVNTFAVTGTVAVTESGVFNAASSGTLLCRQTFTAVNVVSGDNLQITWKVQAS